MQQIHISKICMLVGDNLGFRHFPLVELEVIIGSFDGYLLLKSQFPNPSFFPFAKVPSSYLLELFEIGSWRVKI